MSAQLTIAFVPLDGFGHVNASLGLAEPCRQRGHRCVFLVSQSWAQKISALGFETRPLTDKSNSNAQQSSHLVSMLEELQDTLPLNSFDKIRLFETPGWPPMIEDVKSANPLIASIIADLRPDRIVCDQLLSMPAIVNSRIPWIQLISCNRLYLSDTEDLPPGGSGYPTDGDRNQWQAFRDEEIDSFKRVWDEFNEWLASQGAEPLKCGRLFCNESPYLNLYLFPEELDYTDIAPKPNHWHNIDCLLSELNKSSINELKIVDQLSIKYEKLIYLSMGTLGSTDLTLMRRLVDILSKSPHGFIVSKGPIGDQYELSANMVGENYINQIDALNRADLVITHGGNNTVTEALYFGKPMIVMPVFSDQYDNGQRIAEKSLGVRLDPYHCSAEELLDGIEKLLNNSEIKSRLQRMSDRIRNSKSKINAVMLIENLTK